MFLILSSLLYINMFIIKSVTSVRIFENMLPRTESTTPVEFKAEVLSKTCLLKPQKGPCRANIHMYYYAPDIRECDIFLWGGCQGNGNRFDTIEECRDKCLSKPGGAKSRPKWCSLTFDYGFCFGAIERWYFDNLWKVCKKTLYSGCGGNRNNFYSRYMCESACRFANDPYKDAMKRAQEEENEDNRTHVGKSYKETHIVVLNSDVIKLRGNITKVEAEKMTETPVNDEPGHSDNNGVEGESQKPFENVNSNQTLENTIS